MKSVLVISTFVYLKGEAYYKSLGYKTLMEGVIGEAEKEGKYLYALDYFDLFLITENLM